MEDDSVNALADVNVHSVATVPVSMVPDRSTKTGNIPLAPVEVYDQNSSTVSNIPAVVMRNQSQFRLTTYYSNNPASVSQNFEERKK